MIGDSEEYELMRLLPNSAISPNAAARVRPTNGAVANATEPAASIRSPNRIAWPKAAPSGMASPGSVANSWPTSHVMMAQIETATASAVR